MAVMHDMDMSNMSNKDKNVDVYKFFVEAVAVNIEDNKSIKFHNEWIRSLTVLRRYDPLNMPIIVLNIDADKGVLDSILLNFRKYVVNLTLYKQKKSSGNNSAKDLYIQGQFAVIPSYQPNYNKHLDYAEQNAERDDILHKVSLGLVLVEHLNLNKNFVNYVLNNTTMTNAVTYLLRNYPKVLMEPLEYDDVLSYVAIPPMDTIAKALSHLNDIRVLYKTPYRFFMDFDVTYLLSSSGIKIPKQGEIISTALFVVRNIEEYTSQIEGMITNQKKKLYQVDISATNVSSDEDKVTDKSFNDINFMSTRAISQDESPELNKDLYSNDRRGYIRIQNENVNMAKNIRAASESNTYTVQLYKDNIDGSVFNPNLEYVIRNYPGYSNRDGRFLLLSKDEVFFREDVEFAGTTVFTFKFLAPVAAGDGVKE